MMRIMQYEYMRIVENNNRDLTMCAKDDYGLNRRVNHFEYVMQVALSI